MPSSAPVVRYIQRIPLAGNYPAAVTLALLALCPYLVLTTATSLFRPALMDELGASAFDLQLAAGLSNAGYAFGAVACADLVMRLPRRHVYLFCEGGFVLATVVATTAQEYAQFAIGSILGGLFTGMLLVAALPPLIMGHGVDRLPTTGAVFSLGLFGVVTSGPLLGGLVGEYGGWRYLYTSIAVLAAVGLSFGVLAFEPNEPPGRGTAFDWSAIPFAFGATVLPFFGVAWLTRGSFSDTEFFVPLIVGLLLGVLLVAIQYRKTSPLMPVRPISNTLPVTGTAGAMIVGASFTTLVELAETYLLEVRRNTPLEVGALVTPQLLGAGVAAVLLYFAVRTRWMPYLALSGLVSVVVGAALMVGVDSSSAAVLIPVSAVFLGFGAGAGVTPALFLAGFSVPIWQIGSTFALVELLRSEAAFLVGPVIGHLALDTGLPDGFTMGSWIALIIALGGGVLLIGVYLLGGARPHAPELDVWMANEGAAYHSPPLGARIRHVSDSPPPPRPPGAPEF